MGLMKLTRSASGEPSYVSTEHVITFFTVNEITRIITTGVAESGPYAIPVTESMEEVAQLYAAASANGA
jgi:hypothetical protein